MVLDGPLPGLVVVAIFAALNERLGVLGGYSEVLGSRDEGWLHRRRDEWIALATTGGPTFGTGQSENNCTAATHCSASSTSVFRGGY